MPHLPQRTKMPIAASEIYLLKREAYPGAVHHIRQP